MFYESGFAGPVRLRVEGPFRDWKPPRYTKAGEFLSVRTMLEDAPDTLVYYRRPHGRAPVKIKAQPAEALA